MIRKIFFAGAAVLIMASSAHAGVIFGIILNPTTTAGPNSGSNRSGANTWQVYAVDDDPVTATNQGISSYQFQLTGAGATNHRSPNATFDDSNANPAGSGFSLARQTTPSIAAAEPTPPPGGDAAVAAAIANGDYFPILGFGQTASSFSAKYPSASPANSTAWGNYTSSLVAPRNGHNWVFIAEGTGNPTFVPGSLVVTLFNSATSYTSAFAVNPQFEVLGAAIPEPASLVLLGVAAIGSFGFLRRRRG
jgi:hypothetical protein